MHREGLSARLEIPSSDLHLSCMDTLYDFWVSFDSTDRKIFWILFTLLSLGGYFLPLGWAVAETFVALLVSWWVVYRSGLL